MDVDDFGRLKRDLDRNETEEALKMGNIPIEDLLPRANYSLYQLVSMASARALELSDCKRCLIKNPSSEKLTTIALEEIAEGKIESKETADLRKLKGEAEKADEVQEE